MVMKSRARERAQWSHAFSNELFFINKIIMCFWVETQPSCGPVSVKRGHTTFFSPWKPQPSSITWHLNSTGFCPQFTWNKINLSNWYRISDALFILLPTPDNIIIRAQDSEIHKGGEKVVETPKTEESKNKIDKNSLIEKIQSSPQVGRSKRSTNVEIRGGRYSSSKTKQGTSSIEKKDRSSIPKNKAQSKNLSKTNERDENMAPKVVHKDSKKVLSRSTKTDSTNVRVSKSRNFENCTAHLTSYSFNKIEENQQSQFTISTSEESRKTEEQLDSHNPSKLIVERDQGIESTDQRTRDDDDTLIDSEKFQGFLRNFHGSGEYQPDVYDPNEPDKGDIFENIEKSFLGGGLSPQLELERQREKILSMEAKQVPNPADTLFDSVREDSAHFQGIDLDKKELEDISLHCYLEQIEKDFNKSFYQMETRIHEEGLDENNKQEFSNSSQNEKVESLGRQLFLFKAKPKARKALRPTSAYDSRYYSLDDFNNMEYLKELVEHGSDEKPKYSILPSEKDVKKPRKGHLLGHFIPSELEYITEMRTLDRLQNDEKVIEQDYDEYGPVQEGLPKRNPEMEPGKEKPGWSSRAKIARERWANPDYKEAQLKKRATRKDASKKGSYTQFELRILNSPDISEQEKNILIKAHRASREKRREQRRKMTKNYKEWIEKRISNDEDISAEESKIARRLRMQEAARERHRKRKQKEQEKDDSLSQT